AATNTAITGNQLGPNSGYGILQVDSAGASTGTVAQFNAIVGNSLGGVSNGDLVPDAIIDARKNWWGAPSGPSGVGPGTGDSVSTNVLFNPVATSAACYGLNACLLKLVVTQQPGNAFAGATFGTQPVIQVRDDLGNLQTGSSAQITATILPATAGLAMLSGTPTATTTGGAYTAAGISPGNDVFATAFPPSGVSSLAPRTIGPLIVPGGGGTISGQDIILTAPTGPPAGTSVSPSTGSIPVVFMTNSLTLSTSGCA